MIWVISGGDVHNELRRHDEHPTSSKWDNVFELAGADFMIRYRNLCSNPGVLNAGDVDQQIQGENSWVLKFTTRPEAPSLVHEHKRLVGYFETRISATLLPRGGIIAFCLRPTHIWQVSKERFIQLHKQAIAKRRTRSCHLLDPTAQHFVTKRLHGRCSRDRGLKCCLMIFLH